MAAMSRPTLYDGLEPNAGTQNAGMVAVFGQQLRAAGVRVALVVAVRQIPAMPYGTRLEWM